MGFPMKSLVGQVFGRLTVETEFSMNNKSGHLHQRLICVCICGERIEAWKSNVSSGHTKSCGCYKLDRITFSNKKHGHIVKGIRSPVYSVWLSMLRRCLDPSCISYEQYAELGVTVCDRWHKFENFYADMGDKPEGTSIDRIDNRLGYFKENCRWATIKEQARNKRGSVRWHYRGESLTLEELATKSTMSEEVIRSRLYALKWSVEDAVNIPKHGKPTSREEKTQSIKLYA